MLLMKSREQLWIVHTTTLHEGPNLVHCSSYRVTDSSKSSWLKRRVTKTHLSIFATLWLKSLWNVLKFSIAITANPGVFRRREKLLISRMRERERERERERRSLIEKNKCGSS
jgi:hypothetical protein